VFVSEVRKSVAALLAEGLTLNEIAHRLGVARSTVGYHAEVLREAEQSEPAAIPPRARRGPAAGPK
jgi:DNA-binding transcriptional ArsR family regulator